MIHHESDLTKLLSFLDAYRRDGFTIVWTGGAFDLFHAGHAASLRAAVKFGHALVVGLNSDMSVRALKGEGRPVVAEGERAAVLDVVGEVDHVVIFEGLNPCHVIGQLKPDVVCKGAEYAAKDFPERALVEAYGGRVELLPMVEGVSTTQIIERIVRGRGE